MKQLISSQTPTQSEGSGASTENIETRETDYIMIPVDVLDQYRAKKPRKVTIYESIGKNTIYLCILKVDRSSLKQDVENLKTKLENVSN